MRGTDYLTKHFPGVVQLKDSWENPATGTWFRCIAGRVTILEDTALVGFKTRSTDSNWIARIDGTSGMSVNLLGCQIRAITAYRNGLPTLDRLITPDVFLVP